MPKIYSLKVNPYENQRIYKTIVYFKLEGKQQKVN